MAIPDLLTGSVNYAELLGNGRTLCVPPFQRDYSWTQEQWEDLWTDVADLHAAGTGEHFMGAVVLASEVAKVDRIIDGQQRVATLTVLALAAISRLNALAAEGLEAEANRHRATILRQQFVGAKRAESLLEYSKLQLNRTDDGFFRDYLVQLREPDRLRSRPRSNRLLWECWQFFGAALAGHDRFRHNGSELAGLIERTVGQHLRFIMIQVANEAQAYTIFETLNARGLSLTVTDLLKNYLLGQVTDESDQESLQRQWAEVMASVGQEQVQDLLRYHLLCDYPQVRPRGMYRLLKEQFPSSAAVVGLLPVLQRRAELYAALAMPEHEYWQSNRQERRAIRELQVLGVRQATPLLFAAHERLRDRFAGVLRLTVVVLLRYLVVARRSPTVLEAVFHRAARSVLDGRARSAQDVWQTVRGVYVPDNDFRREFAGLEIVTPSQRRIARYLLARLESVAGPRAVDPDTDPATIEHVLPISPNADWEDSFRPRVRDQFLYRLGNLALLEESANRQVGNAEYAVKAAAYAGSSYALTRAIPEMAPEEWTPAYLEERQRRLADLAVLAWRVDFPEE